MINLSTLAKFEFQIFINSTLKKEVLFYRKVTVQPFDRRRIGTLVDLDVERTKIAISVSIVQLYSGQGHPRGQFSFDIW